MQSPSTDMALGQRIVVVGTSGCGKTHVARALAHRLGLRYICNDAIIWGPGWTPTPGDERTRRFDQATREGAWSYDGNLGSLKDPEDRLILGRADTLVWLDLPRWTIHTQLLRRTLVRVWSRQPLWHGNRETWRNSFLSRDSILWWSVKTFRLRQRQYRAIFCDPAFGHLRRIRLASRRDVDRLLCCARRDDGFVAPEHSGYVDGDAGH